MSLSLDRAVCGYEDWTGCSLISTKREVSPKTKPLEKGTGKRSLEVPEP